MEKFRRWGDAATGIHPFVFPMDRRPLVSDVLHVYLLFPIRIVLAAALLLLLFVADTLGHLLRVTKLGLLANITFVPLGTILCRCVLYVMGGCLVSKLRVLPPKPSPAASSTLPSDALAPPAPGDVILCNLQSPMDVLAIRSAIPIFQGEWGGAFSRGAMFVFYDPVGAARGAPLADFCPSPFQLWKAARFVRHMAKTSSILRLEQSVTNSSLESVPPLPLDTLQRRAMRLGVPVILFAEGATTNGRVILPFPRLQLALTGKKSSSPRPEVYLSALLYSGTPGTPLVVEKGKTALPYLANVCGRAACPSFVAFTVARPSAGATPPPQTSSTDNTDWITSAAWLADSRQKMCALVQYRNPSVVCKPVTVGLVEKVGFVKQYLESSSPKSA